MNQEFYCHVRMDADDCAVAVAALRRYAAEMVDATGHSSTSAAVARELARRVRQASDEITER